MFYCRIKNFCQHLVYDDKSLMTIFSPAKLCKNCQLFSIISARLSDTRFTFRRRPAAEKFATTSLMNTQTLCAHFFHNPCSLSSNNFQTFLFLQKKKKSDRSVKTKNIHVQHACAIYRNCRCRDYSSTQRIKFSRG